jgi:hypothetical protein
VDPVQKTERLVRYADPGYAVRGYGQYKTANVLESTVTVREADHVRTSSETLDKKSACTWDFYPTHATMMLRIDAPTFWFLYEGTPRGRLHPDTDFVVRPDGRKTTLDEPWSEVVPWVCFGTYPRRTLPCCISPIIQWGTNRRAANGCSGVGWGYSG